MDEAAKEDGKKPTPIISSSPKKTWDIQETDVVVGTVDTTTDTVDISICFMAPESFISSVGFGFCLTYFCSLVCCDYYVLRRKKLITY